MNRLVNSIKLGKVSRRNLIMTLLGAILVSAIIFLPEIISLAGKRQIGDGKGAGLNQILASLRPEYPSQTDTAIQSEPDGRTVSKIEPDQTWSDDLSYDLPKRPKFSRDHHRANISRAKQESVILAKRLNYERIQTKFALLDFANSLEIALKGTAGVLSVDEAYDFVFDARSRVVKFVREEKISREQVRPWNVASISAMNAIDFLKCEIAETKAQKEEADSQPEVHTDPALKRRVSPLPLIITKITGSQDPHFAAVTGFIRSYEPLRWVEVRKGQLSLDWVSFHYTEHGTEIFWQGRDTDGLLFMRFVFENGDYFDLPFKPHRGARSVQSLNQDSSVEPTVSSGNAFIKYESGSDAVFKEM